MSDTSEEGTLLARVLAQHPEWLGQIRDCLGKSMRLMVGIPDYDDYVTHMQNRHPGKPVMTYEAFFLERQEARYGGTGTTRCC